MNTFMQKKSFSIKKIRKEENGWTLYPKNSKEATVFISNRFYTRSKLPRHKWFGRPNRLCLIVINDFIVSAELNNQKLFKVEENDYPEEIKEYLAKQRFWQKKIERAYLKDDCEIKDALRNYFPLVPIVQNMEISASELPLCSRAYLKLHLYKNKKDDLLQSRLSLIYLLLKIVAVIYNRHTFISKEDLFYCITAIKASLFYNVKTMLTYDYHTDIDDIRTVFKDESNDFFDVWDEITEMISTNLPPIINKKLGSYLHYITRQMLCLFADDYSVLAGYFSASQNPNYYHLFTDEQDYKYHYKEMKLLNFVNFILPHQFTEKEIRAFLHSYSLK